VGDLWDAHTSTSVPLSCLIDCVRASLLYRTPSWGRQAKGGQVFELKYLAQLHGFQNSDGSAVKVESEASSNCRNAHIHLDHVDHTHTSLGDLHITVHRCLWRLGTAAYGNSKRQCTKTLTASPSRTNPGAIVRTPRYCLPLALVSGWWPMPSCNKSRPYFS